MKPAAKEITAADIAKELKVSPRVARAKLRAAGIRAPHELLNFDMVELRKLPQTRALNENKLRSLEPDMVWWVNCLTRGAITGSTWKELIPRKDVFSSFKGTLPPSIRERSTETSLGIFLRKVIPADKRPRLASRRGEYWLPDLSECRNYFQKAFKVRLGV
jgi:hypothetical protein